MHIAVVGTGYVGIPTGVCLAELGNDVICVDRDTARIENLKNGKMPIYEPGLEELLLKNVRAGRLSFTSVLDYAIEESEIIFVAVGTPQADNGEADMSQVLSVAADIGRNLRDYKIIINKSTVPVGSGELVSKTIREHAIDKSISFDVVSNPEFLREGSAVSDTLKPERIIIGSDSTAAAERIMQLYKPLKAPVLITDLRTAEMIKYASNSFLATKISFINAIANLCETIGADVATVARGMGLDPRIGPLFLNAGLGYGGSCFPKDVKALMSTAERNGVSLAMLREVERVNAYQRELFISKIKEELGVLSGKVIGVLGLAFKPNTDDMREAPSVPVLNALIADGAVVSAYDPMAFESASTMIAGLIRADSPYEAAVDADVLLVLTEWSEFLELDFSKLKGRMHKPVIIDGRNIYDVERMSDYGFRYISMGRPCNGLPV
ncbi:MAG: UDP-glucose/GDP-mannose dehydrogenase family protein [bacterium]|nr:UDP-glucose/GDP-mannose dehydrogenase family protein [bacterium]